MFGQQRQGATQAIRSDRSGGTGATRLVLIAATALILAACQAPHGQLKSSQATDPSPLSAPQPTAKPTPIVATPAVAHSDPAIGVPLRLTGDPKELVGLDHAAVRRALGDPVRIRHDRPAQVWQYSTGDCVVDLYLYNLDGALKVTFVEARSHTAETAPTGRCLKSLLERPTAQAD